METRKRSLSEYGFAIKIKLLQIDRTQEWLIAEVKKETGLYIPPVITKAIDVLKNRNSGDGQ